METLDPRRQNVLFSIDCEDINKYKIQHHFDNIAIHTSITQNKILHTINICKALYVNTTDIKGLFCELYKL